MLRGFRHTLFLVLQLGILASGALALALWPASWPALLVAVLGALGAAFVCERIARQYLRRTLGKLRRAADGIAHGNPNATLSAQPGDDLYKLVQAINTTAGRIAELSEDRARLEEQLRRQERLAFLGELAATVAHEVNNPLDGVQNCVRILRRSDDNPARAGQMLDLIDGGLDRIAMIVRRLLTLARTDTIRPEPVDLHAIVRGALRMQEQRLAGGGVRVACDFAGQTDAAYGDALLLEQVFVNLLANAADAMPEGGALDLSIRREDAYGSDWLRIDVADEGGGIPEQQLGQIFEPFYTTKQDGRGTGLGLPIAARIVQAHGGRIDVAPRETGGTVFTIRLPSRRPNPRTTAAAVAGDAAGDRGAGAGLQS